MDELDGLFRQAVTCHLVADVPIGVLLSGGINSSLVYYYAFTQGQDLTCYTKLSPGIEQIPGAVVPSILARWPSNAYFSRERPSYYVDGMVDFIRGSQAPNRWGGGPPMHRLCQKARALGDIVLLGGDCVDEYFAGYMTYGSVFGRYKDDDFDLGELVAIKKNSALYTPGAGDAFETRMRQVRGHILAALGGISDRAERYKQASLMQDTSVFLQCCNLPHSDAYSMMASVELRNPMLDIDLVQFAANLPIAMKWAPDGVTDNPNKYLMRALSKQRIGSMIDVPKEGTRNFSMAISQPGYWILDNFSALHEMGISSQVLRTLRPKDLFKAISLQVFHALFIEARQDVLHGLLSPSGKEALRVSRP